MIGALAVGGFLGGFAAAFLAEGWMDQWKPPATDAQRQIIGCSAIILGALFAMTCFAVISYVWKHYGRGER